MRKTYHLCLSSHEEVMHRSIEDYAYDVNCFALAVHRTESRALADAVMSTHDHFCVQTDVIKKLAYIRRNAYTRYFNTKYERSGRLGEPVHFIKELEGIRHITAAVSYVNRNPLHHGQTSTPFGYRFCSANAVFRKDLGKGDFRYELRNSKKKQLIPNNCSLPEGYRIDGSGMILQEDIIDVRYVEELYVTPRSFLYMMNRYSDENWVREQIEEDPSRPAVTLDVIEQGIEEESVERMLSNEKGRVNLALLTDMELCGMIDNEYVPKYGKISVYHLADKEKATIGNDLWRRLGRRTNEKQIRRCLVM